MLFGIYECSLVGVWEERRILKGDGGVSLVKREWRTSLYDEILNHTISFFVVCHE